MARRNRKARVDDVHELAAAMPHVTVQHGPSGNASFTTPRFDGHPSVLVRASRPVRTAVEAEH